MWAEKEPKKQQKGVGGWGVTTMLPYTHQYENETYAAYL